MRYQKLIPLMMGFMLVSVTTHAQEAFKAEQGITLESSRSLPAGMFEVLFHHRFSDTIADSNLRSLYGLDSFAFAGFGFLYGIRDNWLVGIYRTNNEKNFELWTRYSLDLTEQLSVGGRVSLNFNSNEGTNDPTRIGFQLLVGLHLGRIDINIAPSYISNPARFEAEDDFTLALGLQAAFEVMDHLSLVGELTPVLDGFRTRDINGNDHPSWGIGMEIEVGDGGHVFTLLITNQSGTTLDQYLPGSTTSNPRLGFNLVRRF